MKRAEAVDHGDSRTYFFQEAFDGIEDVIKAVLAEYRTDIFIDDVIRSGAI